ncbi:Sac2 family-domain-containing protein [Dipodascopsis tothii]|uniref:Sac2 family-domain-containing protein n=1 Tax=Dipodascopsis tothii TaxID=44089 RepID=UPI0034CEC557
MQIWNTSRLTGGRAANGSSGPRSEGRDPRLQPAPRRRPSQAAAGPAPRPERRRSERPEPREERPAEAPVAVLRRLINFEDFQAEAPGTDVRALVRECPGPESVGAQPGQTLAELLAAAEHAEPEHADARVAVRYEEEMERFKDLHVSIHKSDAVLESVEQYLSAFQNDLGLLSAEIETLQNRSIFLNKRLENRRALEGQVVALVDDLLIPPYVIEEIVGGEIGPRWTRCVQVLWVRLRRMEQFKREAARVDPTPVALVDDVEPVLRRLAGKAVERIRDLFAARIRGLRAPGVNAQQAQAGVFLRHRQLYAFLAYVNPELAEGIARGYANTMRWYYAANFGRYVKALERLRVHAVDKGSLLGNEDRRYGILSATAIKAPVSAATRDPLVLGRRINVTFSTDSAVLLEAAAEKAAEPVWMETGFRSFNLALMDNVSAEYLFAAEFFGHKRADAQAALVDSVFEPTYALGEAYARRLAEQAGLDAFGNLLCIRVVNAIEFELQHRKVPAAEAYCHRLAMVLWPRFQTIMNTHADNLRRLSGRPASVAGAEAAALPSISSILAYAGGGGGPTSSAPHAVTQKFASFLVGLLELAPEDKESEPVSISLVRLRNEFEAFLTKISARVGDGDGAAAERERFLFNNYMLVATIISDTEGRLAEQERAHFRRLVDAYRR